MKNTNPLYERYTNLPTTTDIPKPIESRHSRPLGRESTLFVEYRLLTGQKRRNNQQTEQNYKSVVYSTLPRHISTIDNNRPATIRYSTTTSIIRALHQFTNSNSSTPYRQLAGRSALSDMNLHMNRFRAIHDREQPSNIRQSRVETQLLSLIYQII